MEQLRLRNEVIALFIFDPRMREMTGVEFLEKTMDIFLEARRVLLTDYGDTDATYSKSIK